MIKRLLLPTLFLGLAALALAACGSGESDEDKIVNAIETSSTSTDPADCKALLTVAFMEQTNSGEGKEAVEECEEDANDTSGNPDSVEVSEVEVQGSEATADATFNGGNFDGQTLILNLKEEDGDWKLNEIEGFEGLDREKLIGALESNFEESEEVEPELAECVIEGFEEESDSELEETILSGSEGVEEVAEECVE
jgi:ABC-type glycerol-3-phosphate transport system substrate-binding protein